MSQRCWLITVNSKSAPFAFFLAMAAIEGGYHVTFLSLSGHLEHPLFPEKKVYLPNRSFGLSHFRAYSRDGIEAILAERRAFHDDVVDCAGYFSDALPGTWRMVMSESCSIVSVVRDTNKLERLWELGADAAILCTEEPPELPYQEKYAYAWATPFGGIQPLPRANTCSLAVREVQRLVARLRFNDRERASLRSNLPPMPSEHEHITESMATFARTSGWGGGGGVGCFAIELNGTLFASCNSFGRDQGVHGTLFATRGVGDIDPFEIDAGVCQTVIERELLTIGHLVRHGKIFAALYAFDGWTLNPACCYAKNPGRLGSDTLAWQILRGIERVPSNHRGVMTVSIDHQGLFLLFRTERDLSDFLMDYQAMLDRFDEWAEAEHRAWTRVAMRIEPVIRRNRIVGIVGATGTYRACYVPESGDRAVVRMEIDNILRGKRLSLSDW